MPRPVPAWALLGAALLVIGRRECPPREAAAAPAEPRIAVPA